MTTPIGTVYIPEHDRDDDEVRRDIATIADCGLGRVVLWPAVGRDPADPLSLDFTRQRLVLDTCQEHGLEVVVELIGQNPALEYLPDCLLTEESMVLTTAAGTHVSSVCYWPDLTHPKVQAAISEYLTAVVTALKDHPALWGWDLFNETHLNGEGPAMERAFRDWLRRRHGSITALNNCWHRRFTDFDQVRFSTLPQAYSEWSSLSPLAEKHRFYREYMATCCHDWAAIVRATDPAHPILVDNSHSMTCAEPCGRNDDDWLIAPTGDVFGASLYPRSWGNQCSPAQLAQHNEGLFSAARAADKPFVISELQTHTQSALTPGSEVSPEQLRDWTWTSYAHGAEHLAYWRWRPFSHGRQLSGRGLCDRDGSPNQRAEAAREIAAQLAAWGDDFATSRPAPERIGIWYCPDTACYHRIFHSTRPDLYEDNIHGWYQALWARSLAVRFIHSDEAAIPEHIDTLILPGALALDPGMGSVLRAFVERGGQLVADGRCALSDRANQGYAVVPGAGLDELFGIVERDTCPHPTGFMRLLGSGLDSDLIVNGSCRYLPYYAGTAALAGDAGVETCLKGLGLPGVSDIITRERFSADWVYRFRFRREDGCFLAAERTAL